MLKPNEAMQEEAIQIGGKIGVLSTFEPTVASIQKELRDLAVQRGKSENLEITASFVPGALPFL